MVIKWSGMSVTATSPGLNGEEDGMCRISSSPDELEFERWENGSSEKEVVLSKGSVMTFWFPNGAGLDVRDEDAWGQLKDDEDEDAESYGHLLVNI